MAGLRTSVNQWTRRALRAVALVPFQLLGAEDRARVIDRLNKKMIAQIGGGDEVIRFVATTPLLQQRAASALFKEPDTIRWIDSLPAGDVLWDIGANVGTFSLYAAKRRGLRVLAFEPSAGNYMVLCRNIQLNGLGDRITAYCLALSGDKRLGVLNLGSDELGGAVNQFGGEGEVSRYHSGTAAIGQQGMIGYPVDQFIAEFGAPFPNHLKIDVDGLEWAILQGAAKALRDPRLRSMMVELNITDSAEFDRVSAWLAQAGLAFSHQGEAQKSGNEAAANHFFVRR